MSTYSNKVLREVKEVQHKYIIQLQDEKAKASKKIKELEEKNMFLLTQLTEQRRMTLNNYVATRNHHTCGYGKTVCD